MKCTLQKSTSLQVPDCTAGRSGPVPADMEVLPFCVFWLPVSRLEKMLPRGKVNPKLKKSYITIQLYI